MNELTRAEQLSELAGKRYHVLIVGGGINGASCAASLSAAGMSVVLLERGDFASQTSQSSSNLIWGGIKYLQSGSIRLVNKLCRSRNVLIENYPSSVKEIRYFTVLQKSAPSRLLFYIGTWVYWLFGRGFTQKPKLLSAARVKQETQTSSVGGVEYSDAYLPDNDARFTFQFIRSAWRRGATAVNYVDVIQSQRNADRWLTRIRDVRTGQQFAVQSEIIINAAGPMVDEINQMNQVKSTCKIVCSKGVHLIVPRLTQLKKVMTFFANDGRLFFAIPMGTRTCIGTTDSMQEHWQSEVTADDVNFILSNINQQFSLDAPLTVDDVIATRCGVRPLALTDPSQDQSDWMKMSRKHVTEVDAKLKYVTIFGGKLTDCVNVGDEMIKICQGLGYEIAPIKWYGEDPGKLPFLERAAHLPQAVLDGVDATAGRLWRRYGLAAHQIVDMIDEDPSLGQEVIPHSGVLKAEVKYAGQHEMIVVLDDFLRRRTSLSQCHCLNGEAYRQHLIELASLLFDPQNAEDRVEEYLKRCDA